MSKELYKKAHERISAWLDEDRQVWSQDSAEYCYAIDAYVKGYRVAEKEAKSQGRREALEEVKKELTPNCVTTFAWEDYRQAVNALINKKLEQLRGKE